MKQTTKDLSQLTAFLLSILTLITVVPSQNTNFGNFGQLTANIGTNIIGKDKYITYPNSIEYRIAKRLRKRLRKSHKSSPDIKTLADAVLKRQNLLLKNLEVKLVSNDGNIEKNWNVSLSAYPTWIKPEFSYAKASFNVSKENIKSYLNEHYFPGVTPPKDIKLLGTTMSGSVIRARTDGIAMPGYETDIEQSAKQLSEALEYEYKDLTFNFDRREGYILYDTGKEIIPLLHLSQGRSNFKGSTYNRSANVSKAINQHVNNVYIEPGSEFSFNETLNGRVTRSNGWKLAKVIVRGSELELQAGGGICQASTTVYRAIVNSGFPVTKRRSHSLYVSYYKEYGVGIDATIYPGSQDLAFVNETSYPIIIQSYITPEKDAVVNFYGVPDGRSVALKGPYFSSNTPKELEEKWRKVKRNEILWVQKIKLADGQIKENFIISRYKSIPRSLSSEFIVKDDKEYLVQHNSINKIE